MRCRFEGSFTREERRAIRARLRALDVAIEMLGIKEDNQWTVRHVAGPRGDEYVACHLRSGAVLWGATVRRLEREIAKTVTLLLAYREVCDDS